MYVRVNILFMGVPFNDLTIEYVVKLMTLSDFQQILLVARYSLKNY